MNLHVPRKRALDMRVVDSVSVAILLAQPRYSGLREHPSLVLVVFHVVPGNVLPSYLKLQSCNLQF